MRSAAFRAAFAGEIPARGPFLGLRLRLPALALSLGLGLASAGCGGGSGGGPGTATPTVVPPVITQQPQPQTVWSPAPATFTVAANNGGGTLEYQWRRNGVDIPGAIAASYATGPTNVLDHDAAFSVVVKNAAGSVTSSTVKLTVNELPVIQQQPNDLSVSEGMPATFSVLAQGTPPLAYQWKRNGTNLPGATSANYTIASAARTDDQVRFTVVVTNGLGTVESRPATLQVVGISTPPVIAQQPMSLTLNIGQTADFSVTVSGTPPFTYQWRKNGTAIPGATGASLNLPNVQASDAGTYSVVVTNSVGSVTSAGATLTLNLVAPTIVSHPQGVYTGTGTTATFSVVAAGSPPFTYQWRKNGIDISGGTQATYTTPPVTLADNDSQFSVKVTNPAGNITSLSARLQVYLARTVTGDTSVVKVGPVEDVVLPQNLSSARIEAYQLNGQGGYTKTVGTGLPSGTFSIPGLPPGPYLAFVDRKDGSPTTSLWTTLENLELRRYQSGRDGANPSVVGQTSIKVQLSGVPTFPVTYVELYSPTVALRRTSAGPTYSWPWLGLPLFEAAKDQVYIQARKSTPVSTGTLSSIQSSYAVPPFNLPDLGETILTAPLSAPADNASFNFQADIPGFASLLPFVHPAYDSGSGRGGFKVLLRAQPYGDATGPIPEWAEILEFSTSQASPLATGSQPFYDPFPAGWSRLQIYRQEFSLVLPVPGSTAITVQDAIQEVWPSDQLLPASLAPTTAPVDVPLINGVSIFSPPASLGATPILTWSRRGATLATYFVVTVFRVDTGTGKLIQSGDYYTETPSLVLPPGAFTAGQPHLLRISAVWARGYDPQRPFRPAWPISVSPVYSSVFIP